ncbi:TetR/AcrR family transcriptional regulator [Streptomyces sp. NBC_01476]|uniref:TetR/AcrR family transcriptional regulator n=1 Tax=Streptomyces sp. NBC_01476 TaxID=2903881 RepID=UPI002E37B56B|nr:TetR/AcrR family transcriptional regulator [Streptomyces sp. NBC_01476]
MPAPRHERADAARNRRAVLAAAERLLSQSGRPHVTLDQVAVAAGVGKGTVFRRFGSRTGLFTALLEERAAEMTESVRAGAPPLGPGAPPAERLRAFLEALAELAVRNVALLAAHEQACTTGKFHDPTYVCWHSHVTGLLTLTHPEDPGFDAAATAHILLAAFDGDLVQLLAPDGDPRRLAAAVGALAAAATRPTHG